MVIPDSPVEADPDTESDLLVTFSGEMLAQSNLRECIGGVCRDIWANVVLSTSTNWKIVA